MEALQEIQSLFDSKISSAVDKETLEEIKVSFMGKNGLLTKSLKTIATLPIEEKKAFGQSANKLRNYISLEIDKKKSELDILLLDQKIKNESIDCTLPSHKKNTGKTHPISQVIEDVKDIFSRLGFHHVDGPEIEDEWHNFEALNIPEFHPARQMQDTFYTTDKQVLRTHTSPVQIRYLENNPTFPTRIISTGRVYRSDYDATHTPMFHQVEGLYIDTDVNISHLKWCLEQFLAMFFGKEIPIRLRPSYFPFTEPSMEVDILCNRSNKTEIKLGSGNDWLEVLGCGMVHPKVLENVNIDSNKYQGFAFGIGIERIAMLKYGISDLRTFFDSNIKWLDHYNINQ